MIKVIPTNIVIRPIGEDVTENYHKL